MCIRDSQYSDVESDTGSDGLAVNSGGSGRSGDWGPPKRRSKPRAGKQRCHSKPSLTDSGISLSKADSGSFSELSYQQLEGAWVFFVLKAYSYFPLKQNLLKIMKTNAT